MTKTTFAMLKSREKFVKPGTDTVCVKVSTRHYREDNRGVYTADPSMEVVPEHDATVDDILGSWAKLGSTRSGGAR